MTISEWYRNFTHAASLSIQEIRHAYTRGHLAAIEEEILGPATIDHITNTEDIITNTPNFVGNGNWEVTTTTNNAAITPDALREMMEIYVNNNGFTPDTIVINDTFVNRMDELQQDWVDRNRIRVGGFWDAAGIAHPLNPTFRNRLHPVEDDSHPNYR